MKLMIGIIELDENNPYKRPGFSWLENYLETKKNSGNVPALESIDADDRVLRFFLTGKKEMWTLI